MSSSGSHRGRNTERYLAQPRHGVTLIELLVVISIIALLLQLLLVAVQSSREAARRLTCANNVKQIGLATLEFHDVHGGFPPGRWRSNSPTWFVLVLPYLEARNAYELWSLDHKYYDSSNERARLVGIPQWVCPSRPRLADSLSGEDRPGAQGAVGDYAGNVGSYFARSYDPKANGIIITSENWKKFKDFWARPVRGSGKPGVRISDVRDGMSHTILAGEKFIREAKLNEFPDDSSLYNGDHVQSFSRSGGPGFPIAGPRDDCLGGAVGCEKFGSSHSGICQFVLGDGSVRPLNIGIDEEVLGRLCDRADGMPVDLGP